MGLVTRVASDQPFTKYDWDLLIRVSGGVLLTQIACNLIYQGNADTGWRPAIFTNLPRGLGFVDPDNQLDVADAAMRGEYKKHE